MKVAILTKPDYSSPRVLAETLRSQLEPQGVQVKVFQDINLLTRLVEWKKSGLSFHFWVKEKIVNYVLDNKVINQLKNFDAVVVCECTPNGFRRLNYNVERLRKILQKPVLYYEVYYLGNAPSQIKLLEENGDALLERYDYHLSVATVTEIRQKPSGNWYGIGLYSKAWGLQPNKKESLIAIVDFQQPGYELYRAMQIRALKRAGIHYFSLEKRYSFVEIRKIYQAGGIFLIQFPEAFGLPILESLCCGSKIFTPEAAWLMAWNLDSTKNNSGVLPNCFEVYENEEDLVKKLLDFKHGYDPIGTPRQVFKDFLDNYNFYYYGNESECSRLLEDLKSVKV